MSEEQQATGSPPPFKKEDPPAFPQEVYPTEGNAKFLAETLGASLSRGLAEVVMRKPIDPIEYLAEYLYAYRRNCQYYEDQAELAEKVTLEMEAYEREQERQARLREEAKISQEKALEREKQQKLAEIQKKEEEERKARDSLLRQRPELPTLQEGDEEEEQLRARDEWGQTQLHLLAGKEGSELHALLQQGYNIADRDVNGKTPRDHAKDSEIKENVDLIDEYVIELFHQERSTEIIQLVMNGYFDQMPDLSNITNFSEKMKKLTEELPQIQEKLTAMFEAVSSGDLARVKEALDQEMLAQAKNQQGQSALHIAVLKNHKDIVEYLVQDFPATVNCKDNLSRQPLHYAYAVSEELVTLLLEHEADKDAEDAKKKLPNQYAGLLNEIEPQLQP